MQPLEAECKFRVPNRGEFLQELSELGGRLIHTQKHEDTYLRHPCRDFRATDEALRIRRIDQHYFVTYKGPRLAGPVKIRPEIELELLPSTIEGWLKIWQHLGFTQVHSVAKIRTVHHLDWQGRTITITLDEVEKLGTFAEIEILLKDKAEIDLAQTQIIEVSKSLGLTEVEPRSYLSMVLMTRETEVNDYSNVDNSAKTLPKEKS